MRVTAHDVLVSPSELVDLLRRLEPRAVRALETTTWKMTATRLRHLEQYGVSPRVPASGVKGDGSARLYDAVDVAFLRVWLRIAAEVGQDAARYTLVYLSDVLRPALAQRRPYAVVVTGKRAALVLARFAETVEGATAVVSLAAVLDGVTDAMTAVRTAQPAMWAGYAWRTSREIASERRMRA